MTTRGRARLVLVHGAWTAFDTLLGSWRRAAQLIAEAVAEEYRLASEPPPPIVVLGPAGECMCPACRAQRAKAAEAKGVN